MEHVECFKGEALEQRLAEISSRLVGRTRLPGTALMNGELLYVAQNERVFVFLAYNGSMETKSKLDYRLYESPPALGTQ